MKNITRNILMINIITNIATTTKNIKTYILCKKGRRKYDHEHHLPVACFPLPVFKCQKWHFERPNLRTDSKNLTKHPLNWWGRHLVPTFPFLGKYQANFEKLHILYPFGPILEGEKAKN